MLTTLIILIGALFRRWWGGFLSPNHFVKIMAGFLLSVLIFCLYLKNSYIACGCGLILGTSFTGWVNPWHAESQNMGYTADSPPMKSCVTMMSLSYGAFTFLAGLAWLILGHSMAGIIYMPMGLLTPCAYLFGWWFYRNVLNEKDNFSKFIKVSGTYAIDGPTSLGELGLGALMLGGIALAGSL